EDRQLAGFERAWFRPGGVIRGADVNPSGREVLAGHLRVVASGARALQGIAQADGVDMRYVTQPKLAEHEDVRAAGDGCTVVIVALPLFEQTEDLIIVVVAEHARA